MKLFQKLLVASTAMSLITPLAAQASDTVNLEEMNSYANSNSKVQRFDNKTFINEVSEDIANLKGRVDGLEAQQNVFEAGAFSDTTVMDGKAVFDIGAIDYSETDGSNETVQFAYSYRLNLNTSFTGDDNLYVRLLSGNHTNTDWMADSNDGGYLSSVGKKAALTVDKIWYSFPVGENNTVWVGPKIENYYMHGTAPSIYKPVTKQFTLGGNGNAYGASTDTGAGWAYKADNGFAISSNIGTKSHTTQKDEDDNYVPSGLLTDETKTSWATQIGYTQPQYAVSAIVNLKYNGWADGYLHTAAADDALVDGGNHTAVGLRGWWRPQDTGTATPSVSLGYDTTQYGDVATGTDSSDMWFVGLQWQDIINPDDKIGLAFAQPTMHDDETSDPFAYELYYSYKANDSITITPAIFGGSDRDGGTEDVFGALLQTTFKF
tara:strand:- start:315 stop:1616 length:1302 start_codon:yes stop_codon:yes gene_type:complete